MATGDVYVVKMFQTYFTQACLNVFFYRQGFDAAPAVSDAQGLFEAFDEEVLSQWKGMVSTSMSIVNMEVTNILSPTDSFFGTPVNNVGTRALGDNLRAPSWIAASFKSNRAGSGSRSSFKRFAGIGEIDIDDNVIAPSFVSILSVQNLKQVMGDFIDSTGGSAYDPVQVKSGWRLGFLPVINFNINTWADPTLTSQVSRKP